MWQIEWHSRANAGESLDRWNLEIIGGDVRNQDIHWQLVTTILCIHIWKHNLCNHCKERQYEIIHRKYVFHLLAPPPPSPPLWTSNWPGMIVDESSTLPGQSRSPSRPKMVCSGPWWYSNSAVSLLNLGEFWFDLDWMAFHEAEAQQL